MNEEINNQTTNRFIFSNDFYERLSSNDLNDNNSDNIDNNKVENIIPPQINEVLPTQPELKPSYEQREEKETKINIPEVQDSSINLNNISNNDILNKPLETENNILTINESNSIENTISNNITEQSTFDNNINSNNVIEIPKIEETTKVEESNISPKLDVETGINTDLEQQILNYQYQPETINQPQIIENSMWGEQNKKTVYRATRNRISNSLPTEPNNNISIPSIPTINKVEEYPVPPQEEIKKLEESEIKEKSWEPTPQAPIHIKDGELEKIKEMMRDNKPVTIIKSNLLNELRQKEQQTGKISILARYGEDFCSKDYITNPAIGRNEEIKQLILILLTPEKSAILVGKPGIGKTSIVEGLAYQLQRSNVPDALRGYRIVSVKSTSLIGTLPTGETRLQTLIDELKELDKIILFIDETHMLMGATDDSSLDFANMFKESLGRGSIKMIGATTNDEYERYVLRDKAFVRRFQRVDVEEPSREHTIKILMGTLPKIEKNTGAKLKYSNFIQSEIMAFIVDITTEYKRIYGIGSRYPDICLTLLAQAFSQAVFDNRKEVNIFDIRNAIENSKNIYPDVIRKELINFDEKFKQIIKEEKAI